MRVSAPMILVALLLTACASNEQMKREDTARYMGKVETTRPAPGIVEVKGLQYNLYDASNVYCAAAVAARADGHAYVNHLRGNIIEKRRDGMYAEHLFLTSAEAAAALPAGYTDDVRGPVQTVEQVIAANGCPA